MKTAISIPDEVFRKAERAAKRMGLSRSELYAKAVDSFIQERDSRTVRNKLNRVYESEASELDPGLQTLQSHALPREDW